MMLRMRYAMSGTDLAYQAHFGIALLGKEEWSTGEREVLAQSGITLRPSYDMSGTGLCPVLGQYLQAILTYCSECICLRACYAVCGTDLLYAATRQASRGLCGMAYGPETAEGTFLPRTKCYHAAPSYKVLSRYAYKRFVVPFPPVLRAFVLRLQIVSSTLFSSHSKRYHGLSRYAVAVLKNDLGPIFGTEIRYGAVTCGAELGYDATQVVAAAGGEETCVGVSRAYHPGDPPCQYRTSHRELVGRYAISVPDSA
eukprot:2198588-Rhodomonas_salina.2